VTTFLLARHGETEWNREERYQGHADPPLNEIGRGQAEELANDFGGPVDAIFSSDLRRASETAQIVGARASRQNGLRTLSLRNCADRSS